MLAPSPAALLALAIVAAPAPESDSPPVRCHFELGKIFYQEVRAETRQVMKVSGQEIKQNQTQTFWYSWTPEKHTGNDWVLRMKIEGVKVDIDIGGGKISYDSTQKKGNDGGPLANYFQALVGAEFRVTVKDGRTISKVEGAKEFIQRMAQKNEETEMLLRSLLNESALKEMAAPLVSFLPPRRASRGDSWNAQSHIDMGPCGGFDTTWEYLHQGEQGRLTKVRTEIVHFRFHSPVGDLPAKLPFRVTAENLKTKKGTGTILFDARKGRLDSFEKHLDLEGELTVEIGSQETRIQLSQSQKGTTKVTDMNPLKK